MNFLQLKDVFYKYKQQQDWMFKEMSLEIKSDEAIGLVGHNGSGKTTLTKLLVGALQPMGGKIFLEGQDLTRLSLAQIGRKVGYAFQNPDQQLFAATVEAEIRFGMENMKLPAAVIEERADYYLTYFNLQSYRHTYPLHLSQGEKRRLVLAAILAMQPQFLILDEPTVGLDANCCEQLRKILHDLKQKSTGMIIISHDQFFLEKLVDRFIRLEGGKVADDWRNEVVPH